MMDNVPDAEIKRGVPEIVLDNIYIALLEAYERLPDGKANIKRCLNYLEESHRYEPPKGYVIVQTKKPGEITYYD